MFKSDNTVNILLGKDLERTAGAQITDIGGAGFIANGEILILDENDNVMVPGATYADTKSIRIVQGKGLANDVSMKSSTVINGRGILSAVGRPYQAAVEQQTFVGYNAVSTTGSIVVQAYEDYKLTIVYKSLKEVFSEQLLKRTFYYTTGASDTQDTIATAFVDMINADEFPGVLATKVDNGTDFGIQLDGEALDFDFNTVGDFEYNKVIFEVLLSGFGATDLTYEVASDRGNGTPEQIAELEWFTNGFDGAINRVYHPAPAGHKDVDASAVYDVITIEHVIPSKDWTISGPKPVRNLLYIAIVEDSPQATDLLAVLNPWIASLPNGLAAVAV